MIIKIHESVFTHEVTKINPIVWLRFLSCIVRTAECGHHFIIIHPQMLDYINEIKSITEHQRNILIRIIRRSLYNFDELDEKKTITFTLVESTSANVINIFETNATEIDKIIQVPEIILEDIEDDIIYKQILSAYIEHEKITAHFYYYPLNGGGDGSHRLVSIHYKRNRNIYAIFDTDRKHPEDNIGKTARQLIREFSNIGLQNNYHELDCHEVENLHPLQSLIDKADKMQTLTVSFLEHAIEQKQDSYKFFDLKKSHKFCEIFTGESSLAKYWREIYKTFDSNEWDLNSFIDDQTRHNDTLTPKLSTVVGLLKDDIAKCNYKHTKISEIRPAQLQETWKSIGRAMLAWTISAPEIIL